MFSAGNYAMEINISNELGPAIPLEQSTKLYRSPTAK